MRNHAAITHYLHRTVIIYAEYTQYLRRTILIYAVFTQYLRSIYAARKFHNSYNTCA
jgi:hypothetical protein